MPDHQTEELLLMGTGLRESLGEPIQIRRYDLLAEAVRPRGVSG